jgi:biotin-(acetyl-CoA carboxylase) ligase
MQYIFSISRLVSGFKWKAVLPLALLSLFLQGSLSAGDWYSDLPKSRIHLYEVDSTQAFAREHAEELLTEQERWVVITADHLKNVRSNGNLFVTFMTLYPTAKTNELLHLIQISTLSLTKTLKNFHLDPAEIKWPNEVLVDEKKIASCFCEAFPSFLDGYSYLLIGIELNVNTSSDEIALLSEPSTSMAIEAGEVFDREKTLKIIAYELMESTRQFLVNDFRSYFYCAVDQLLAFKNRLVEIELGPNSIVRGKFIGIDGEGCMILEMAKGKYWKIEHGKMLRVLDEQEYKPSDLL